MSSLKQTIKQQYKRCFIDPCYFMKNYCYIIHMTRGKIKFNLYPFQQQLIQSVNKYKKNIILKSRQMGISTTSAGYTIWLMFFHEHQSITIIANKEKVAKNLLQKIMQMYDNLPSWMKKINPIQAKNATCLKLKNGSQVNVQAATQDAGRSKANSLLIIDQMAIIKQNLARKIWTSANMTLATGGRCILLSTPNGIGNQFHQLWVNAQQGKNGFNPIRLPWYLNPDFDQNWRSQQTLQMGQALASQQCDCSFLSNKSNVIDLQILSQYHRQSNTPLFKLLNNNLWIWKQAIPQHNYIISADVARGDGSDYSAFQILDLVTLQQVAEYQGKQDTTKFGKLLASIGKMYNEAWIVCQNNNIGWDTVKTLVQVQYPKLYKTIKGQMSLNQQKIQTNILNYNTQEVPGFSTNSKSRPLMINKMKKFILQKLIKINSLRTINQLTSFIYDKGKPQAMQGKNDDLVMSLAIGIWVRDIILQSQQINSDYLQILSTSFIKSDCQQFTLKNFKLQQINQFLGIDSQEYEKVIYKDWI